MVGLPHTQLTLDDGYTSCAFSAKSYRLAAMLRSHGHEVVTMWGGDKADVSLMSVDEQLGHFGVWNPGKLPVVVWDANLPYWQDFHRRAITEVKARVEAGDLIAVVGGAASQVVVDAFKARFTCIEPGVGYEGICRDTFCCFESYAWMHVSYGRHGIGDGRAFDVVIPNAIDPDDWTIDDSSGYALFVGRFIDRKGPHAAVEIARAAGLPLVMAGAGATQTAAGIVSEEGWTLDGAVPPDVIHVGTVSGDLRRALFARAEVLICPTKYIGPWEGVHAEAGASGVGTAAPDYGVFTETLPPEYRYRSLRQAVDAVNRARETRGQWWRDRTLAHCGIERCARLYDEWIGRLATLRNGGTGWYDGYH